MEKKHGNFYLFFQRLLFCCVTVCYRWEIKSAMWAMVWC